MSVQLLLVRGDEVVCRTQVQMPGSERGPREEIGLPMLQRLAAIFAIAANERRLRLMLEIAKRAETRFTDLLPIGVNPKLVHDCLEPMLRDGLVSQASKRSPYALTVKGAVVVAALTAGMSDLLQAAEESRI